MKKRVIVYLALAASVALPATVRASTYATTILADSPVLYYRLDEASGTTAFDSALGDGAQNGTYVGAYSLNQPGALASPNAAVRLNPLSTDSTGHINSTFVLNPTSAFTVEFWLKLPTLNDGNTEEDVFAQGHGVADNGRSIVYWDDPNQRMTSNLGGSFATDFWTSSSGVTAGNYFYVAFVYNGTGNVTWYLNGVANGTISGITPVADGDNTVIGDDKFRDGTISALNGTLDEFAVYNTALNASQIAAHFAAESLVPEPSSVLLAVVGSWLLWRRYSAYCRSSR